MIFPLKIIASSGCCHDNAVAALVGGVGG